MAKILYVASTSEHLERFHVDYIEALKKDGHEVITMAAGDGVDLSVPFEKKLMSIKNLHLIPKIRKILKRENFDAILLNTTLAAFCIRMALGKRRPAVVNFVHGYMFSERPRGFKEKLFLFAERLLKNKTDAIMVMNEEDHRIVKKYGLTDGETALTRGMGVKKKAAVEEPKEIRKRLGAEKKFVICFVGELRPIKNQESLIRIMPQLQKKISEAVLWLVGDGKEKSRLASLSRKLNISEQVKFIGYVNNPTDYVRACDLYLTPSKKEGLPFNLLEALGEGMPIIASDVKGHRDLIEDGVTGLLYKTNCDEELISNILTLYDKSISLNEKKQREVFFEYSFERVFEDTYRVMKRLMRL